ncbi:MAG: hypothetical protein WB559_07295 [Candidatus Acidiferrales bacterium]
MFRRTMVLIAAGIVSLSALSPTFAQEAAPNTQTTTQPASPSDKKDSPAPKAAQKPKKVWTNDDMSDLHANSTVSVVGNQKKNAQPTDYRAPGQSEYAVKMYRQQIDQLQTQVAGIDKQIANLQDAKNGKTVETSRKYDPWGGKQGDWNSQIDQLQKNRENVLQQIDSLESQIRKLNP